MSKSKTIFWVSVFYLLLTGSQCTETIVTTEVRSEQKISANEGGGPNRNLDNGDQFGHAVARIGDLEGDGVIDLAVGAPFDDDNGTDRGAVWILFLNSNGTVDVQQKISDNLGNFSGDLDNSDRFGSSVTAIGDLNADGFLDIAVGAPFDDDGGSNRGAVWILFLNADGTVQSSRKISSQTGGFTGDLDNDDQFGSAVTSIGDLDGDGITDLAVGAEGDSDDGSRKGAIWILFMNSDGSVRSSSKISQSDGGFDGSLAADGGFGGSLAGIGDLNGDGVEDIAAGANQNGEGSVWILLMNANGTVRNEQRIAENEGKFEGTLEAGDAFGGAVAGIGDLDNDGINDIAVGAAGDDDGGSDRGAVWVLFMKTDGDVDGAKKISNTDGKLDADLDNQDRFGSALAGLGDLNNDGDEDFAAGAPLDDDDRTDAGAVWVLFMDRKEKEERTGFLFDNN